MALKSDVMNKALAFLSGAKTAIPQNIQSIRNNIGAKLTNFANTPSTTASAVPNWYPLKPALMAGDFVANLVKSNMREGDKMASTFNKMVEPGHTQTASDRAFLFDLASRAGNMTGGVVDVSGAGVPFAQALVDQKANDLNVYNELLNKINKSPSDWKILDAAAKKWPNDPEFFQHYSRIRGFSPQTESIIKEAEATGAGQLNMKPEPVRDILAPPEQPRPASVAVGDKLARLESLIPQIANISRSKYIAPLTEVTQELSNYSPDAVPVALSDKLEKLLRSVERAVSPIHVE